MRAIVFVVLCVVGVAGQADEIIGTADVIDGDSIRIGSEEIRLQSIDAAGGQTVLQGARKGLALRAGGSGNAHLSSQRYGYTLHLVRA